MEELPHLGRPICVIGRYALYGKLAAGGMATVHFGRLLGPAGFSRTVAIKRLHPQFAKDPEFVAMFLDEARLAARIQHPNVVATVDVVAMAEELFLVMDYVRGESFSRLLRSSRKKGIEIPLGIITNVAAGMLHGLHAAHEAKDEQGRPLSVVHRDVSPQNVLVGVDGVARVLDFGVAKAAARIQVTRDGQMKGKLSYMAPEQLQGRGVDRRTDVFAAAIVTWEALTGRRLFDAEEPQEVLRMIVSEDIPPPRAVVPSIPRTIDAIVMKGLARDVLARYQTAREFAIALEEATQLASPREVGEWVEQVAGETLLRRERAVAEIEAISAVSDVSLVTGAAPGFTSTVVGLPPPPLAATASDWDEGPTRIYDSAAAVSLGDDQATRVHVPRPSSRPGELKVGHPPKIPSVVPPAARAPMRPRSSSSRAPPKPSRPPPLPGRSVPPNSAVPSNINWPQPDGAVPSKTSNPPPRGAVPSKTSNPPPRGAVPSKTSNPPPRGAVPSKTSNPPPPKSPDLLDDGEQTQVNNPFDSSGENEPTQVLDKSQPGWDDEGETTQVIDKSGDDLLDAAARVTGPPQGAWRASSPAPRPAAGSPPAVTTIIVQDDTSPDFRRPAPWVIGLVWLWGSPAARARRVGLVAGVAGLLVGVAYGYGAHGGRPRAPRASQRMAEEPHSERPPVVATSVAEPQPRGIDPSMLPQAPPDETKARHVARVKPVQVSLDTATSSPPAARAASAAPATPSPPADDDLASPYAHAVPAPAPRATKPPSAPVAKSLPRSAPPASAPVSKASAPKAVAGCAQPFTLDDHGIRRIKPECL
jgi:serine/threonine protein kinase